MNYFVAGVLFTNTFFETIVCMSFLHNVHLFILIFDFSTILDILKKFEVLDSVVCNACSNVIFNCICDVLSTCNDISSDSPVAKNLKNSKKCSKTNNESTTTESKHSLPSFKYEDNSDNIFGHKKKRFQDFKS